jgi:hypothetical protein
MVPVGARNSGILEKDFEKGVGGPKTAPAQLTGGAAAPAPVADS